MKVVPALEEEVRLVDHPRHYTYGQYECIDVIEDWFFNNYNLASALKYLCRVEHKGRAKQDIEKAIWFLKRELERIS